MARSSSCPLPVYKKLCLIASGLSARASEPHTVQQGGYTVSVSSILQHCRSNGAAFGKQVMLRSGAFRCHVLSSCPLLRTYACRTFPAKHVPCPLIPSSLRRVASLSWQVQHAKQGAALPGLGHVVRQQSDRSRGICTSTVSCSATQPKTVRDIVRELKKGEHLCSHSRRAGANIPKDSQGSWSLSSPS